MSSSSNHTSTQWNPEAEGWVPRVHHPPQQQQQQQIPVNPPIPIPRYPNPIGPCPRRAFDYFPTLEREEGGSRTFDRDPEVRHIWTSGVGKNIFTFFTFSFFSLCVYVLVFPLYLLRGRIFYGPCNKGLWKIPS